MSIVNHLWIISTQFKRTHWDHFLQLEWRSILLWHCAPALQFRLYLLLSDKQGENMYCSHKHSKIRRGNGCFFGGVFSCGADCVKEMWRLATGFLTLSKSHLRYDLRPVRRQIYVQIIFSLKPKNPLVAVLFRNISHSSVDNCFAKIFSIAESVCVLFFFKTFPAAFSDL